ncbi:MAG: HAD domain-containing protein [Burkholderiaceae bacterium]|nr:HAD domain-containing protein [Burkholderiaceae bacterium]
MILFLDFDGVVHPEPCYAKDAFRSLHMIEGVLREFPAVEIVISSTWRLTWKYEDESIPQMRKHFAPDIAHRVVGVTPDFRYLERDSAPDGLSNYQREWECIAWLRTHRYAWTPWLALDDRPYWFKPFTTNLMVTDHKTGFEQKDEAEFRQRLALLVQAGGSL